VRIRYFDITVDSQRQSVVEEIKSLIHSPALDEQEAGVRFHTLLAAMERDSRPYGTHVNGPLLLARPLEPTASLMFRSHLGSAMYHSASYSLGTGRAVEVRVLFARDSSVADAVSLQTASIRHGLMETGHIDPAMFSGGRLPNNLEALSADVAEVVARNPSLKEAQIDERAKMLCARAVGKMFVQKRVTTVGAIRDTALVANTGLSANELMAIALGDPRSPVTTTHLLGIAEALGYELDFVFQKAH